MTGQKNLQPHAKAQNPQSNAGHARNSWWIWIACGCLLLAMMPIVAGPAVQTLPQSRAVSPDVSENISPTKSSRLPRIEPDYIDVVIPPNLAPLNLTIKEPGIEYRLRVSGSHGQPIELHQSHPQVRFPMREWKELLANYRGSALRWDFQVRNSDGQWIAFNPFESRIAEEEIDPYVVYRRLHPLYTSFKHLNIYQRNLETFDEKPVVRNDNFGNGCVNCHTFQQGNPDQFAISFRSRTGTPTLLIDSNRITRVDVKMGYLSWHPNGKLLAFADNTITQFFHIAGSINRDIYDPNADIKIYHLDSQTVEKPPAISAPNRSENWPRWSVDGRYLYYSSAPTVAFRDERNFRSDLMRIPYDSVQNRWGEPETLFFGAEQGLSAHQPRMSPDGRYLMFTVSDSGSFPAFRSNSDLYLLRLDTRKVEPLSINSNHQETWPCWSSNGRWLIFGSRRLDGVFARLFITHVDPNARFSKPFLLPQEDPAYYGNCLDNFNVPELVRGPIHISEEELIRVVNTPSNKIGSGNRETSNRDQTNDRSYDF